MKIQGIKLAKLVTKTVIFSYLYLIWFFCNFSYFFYSINILKVVSTIPMLIIWFSTMDPNQVNL